MFDRVRSKHLPAESAGQLCLGGGRDRAPSQHAVLDQVRQTVAGSSPTPSEQ